MSLHSALNELLSDGAQVAVAEVDGELEVVAVDGNRLIWFHAAVSSPTEPDAETDALLHVHSMALDADTRVQVEERTFQHGQSEVVRERNWEFGRLGETVVLKTEELLVAAWHGEKGPRPGELVARDAARRVGWQIPKHDAQPSS
jgi:hypothetical protein